MIAFLSGVASRVWLWIAGAVASLAVLAGIYASIRRGGRDAQQADQAADVARRTRLATQARIEAKPMTSKEEAADPFNRDRFGQ